MKINVVNNYYKPGPCSDPQDPPMQMKDGDTTKAQGFMSGNYFEGMPGRFNTDNYSAVIYTNTGNYMSTSREQWAWEQPFPMNGFQPVTQTAQEAYQACLRYAGCSLARDRVDQRIIRNVALGEGELINSQDDVGGWDDYPKVLRRPDWDIDGDGMPGDWEKKVGLDPEDASDRNGDLDGDGYTNLEQYINGLAPDMTEVLREKRE